MDDAVVPFIRQSTEINETLLRIFDGLLGLPCDTLLAKHSADEFSGSEARVTRSPPRPDGIDEAQAALAAHTDFGSLSFLHNRLGGLQVMVPGTDQWQYVRVRHFPSDPMVLYSSQVYKQPISGHAICNLGDAMTIFSGGLLKSNLHRVVYVSRPLLATSVKLTLTTCPALLPASRHSIPVTPSYSSLAPTTPFVSLHSKTKARSSQRP